MLVCASSLQGLAQQPRDHGEKPVLTSEQHDTSVKQSLLENQQGSVSADGSVKPTMQPRVQAFWIDTRGQFVPPADANLFDNFDQTEPEFSRNRVVDYSRKRFDRNRFHLDGRLGTDPESLGNLNDYRIALSDYLADYPCNMPDPADWQFVGPTPAQFGGLHQMGHVSAALMFEDNFNEILLASSTSGIWKTFNLGLNWVNVTQSFDYPTLGISSIAQSPDETDLILAGCGASHGFIDPIGAGLIRSADRGNTWSQINLPVTATVYPRVNDVTFDPNDPSKVWAVTDKEVFVSMDEGLSWSSFPVPADLGIHNYFYEIAVLPVSGHIVLTSVPNFASDHQLWVRYGGTSTWDNITYSLDYGSFTGGQSVKLSKPYGSYLAISYRNHGGDRTTMVSNDYGDTFNIAWVNTTINSGAGLVPKFEVEFSKSNPSECYYGALWLQRYLAGGTINTISTGGSSNFHLDVRFIQVISGLAGQDMVLVGKDGDLGIEVGGQHVPHTGEKLEHHDAQVERVVVGPTGGEAGNAAQQRLTDGCVILA